MRVVYAMKSGSEISILPGVCVCECVEVAVAVAAAAVAVLVVDFNWHFKKLGITKASWSIFSFQKAKSKNYAKLIQNKVFRRRSLIYT